MNRFKSNEFVIPFIGLKNGVHQYDYSLDSTFFELFDFTEFKEAELKVTLNLEKRETFMNATFIVNGWVGVTCDLTNENFNQDLDDSFKMIIKFGDEYLEVEDDVLIIPRTDYEIDVSKFIFETIVLAIPSKKIHPGVKDGTLDSDILRVLENMENSQRDENDSRWDDLKNLNL